MNLRISCIAVSAVALGSFANADIIYNDLTETAGSGESVSFDINGLNYEFGIETGGPLDYAYVTTTSEGAGLFVPLLEETTARNFSAGDSIGTLTSVLNMFPLGGGSENINLAMFDFNTNTGNWNLGETGYVGFGFGSGIDFNYGWMSFELTGDEEPTITLTGWAYNDVVNGSITAGQMAAVPGPAAAAAAFGLFGIRRNRRRG